MNLAYGNIIKIFNKDGQLVGKVKIKGVMKEAPLMLVLDAKEGDEILLCDGIPISKIISEKKGENYVSGDPGKSS